MTSIEWLDEQIQEYVIAVDHVANTMVIQISFEEYMDLKRQAKEMHHKELMESMQKGMELQEKENNRIGFRERNGLLPQQKILDEEIEKRVKEVGAMGEYYKWGYKDAIIWYKEQLKQRQ